MPAEVVDDTDMGMIERSNRLRLSFESRLRFRCLGDVIEQYLDSNRTIETGIMRPVDLAHAACADNLDNLVVT